MNGVLALFGFIVLYDSIAMAYNKNTITAEVRDSFTNHPIQTSLGVGCVVAHLRNWPKGFRRIDAFEGYALIFGYIAQKIGGFDKIIEA